MAGRRRSAARGGGGPAPGAPAHNWFERFVFRFMGPPDVGDPSTPVRASTRPPERCPRCGRPMAEHEVVRNARLTYTRCPTDPS